MKIKFALAVAGLSAALAMPSGAQTIKKIGDATHHVLKDAGNGIKKGAKDVGGATHHELQKAGNATKTTAGNVTGIHKVGGDVGKAAQGVSHAGKKVARKGKSTLKHGKAEVHADLTMSGKDTKAEIKKP